MQIPFRDAFVKIALFLGPANRRREMEVERREVAGWGVWGVISCFLILACLLQMWHWDPDVAFGAPHWHLRPPWQFGLACSFSPHLHNQPQFMSSIVPAEVSCEPPQRSDFFLLLSSHCPPHPLLLLQVRMFTVFCGCYF